MRIFRPLLNLMDVRKMPKQAFPPDRLWPFIWHFMGQYRRVLVGVGIFGLLSSAAMASGPYMLRKLLDTIIQHPDPEKAWVLVMPALALYVLVAVVLHANGICNAAPARSGPQKPQTGSQAPQRQSR